MTAEAKAYFNRKANALLILLGQQLVNNAKHYCPVGQYTDGRVGGRLRGSITFATSNTKSQDLSDVRQYSDLIKPPAEEFTVRVGTAVEYAPYVEFGTSKMANTPFLRPALLSANIKALIKKAGFK